MRVRSLSDEDATAVAEYTNWIRAIGEGRVATVDDDGRIAPPGWMIEDDLQSAIEFAFPNIEAGLSEVHLQSAILTARNKSVHEINDVVLDKAPGDAIELFSSDMMVNDDDAVAIPMEVLNSYVVSGLPLHVLRLKVGCPVMVLRNLNPDGGVCNGTRVKIIEVLDGRLLKVEVLMGQHKGSIVFIPRIPLHPPDNMLTFH